MNYLVPIGRRPKCHGESELFAGGFNNTLSAGPNIDDSTKKVSCVCTYTFGAVQPSKPHVRNRSKLHNCHIHSVYSVRTCIPIFSKRENLSAVLPPTPTTQRHPYSITMTTAHHQLLPHCHKTETTTLPWCG